MSYIDDYLAILKANNFAQNTLAFYSRYLPFLDNLALKYYNKNIYKMSVSELTRLKLDHLNTYSKSSQNAFFGMLKGLESYLIAEGVIDYVGVTNILYNRLDVNYSKSFALEDMPRLKQICTNRPTWAAIVLLIMSGLRINELVNLALKDIDLANSKIWVQPSKNHSGRGVEVLQIQQQKDLVVYLRGLTPIFGEIYPFADAKAQVRYAIDAYNQQYNCSFSTHNTRSTYATYMYIRGTRLDQLMRFLGHKNIKTTLKYIDSRR